MTADDFPCPRCQKPMRLEPTPYEHEGRLLGSYPAYVCPEGHEPFFTEEAARAIQARLMELGAWGPKAKARVRITQPPLPG